MWIAVDKNGTIVGFKNLPTRYADEWSDGGPVTIFPNFKQKFFKDWNGNRQYREVSNEYIFKQVFGITKKNTWKDGVIWIADNFLEKRWNKIMK